MDAFERAFAIVVGEEGAFGADPRDTGNWTGGRVNAGELRGTKYGISAAAYPDLDIRNLTLDQARAIYRRDYFERIRGDALPWPWALAVFDSAVNQGVSAAVTMMQDAVGVQADGVIGPRTLAAVQGANDRHFARFMSRRARRYASHPRFSIYADGWFTRLFVIAQHAAA